MNAIFLFTPAFVIERRIEPFPRHLVGDLPMMVDPVALYARREREKIKRDGYIERIASEKTESKSERRARARE